MRVSLRVSELFKVKWKHRAYVGVTACLTLWTDSQPVGQIGWDSDGFTRWAIVKGTAVQITCSYLPDHLDGCWIGLESSGISCHDESLQHERDTHNHKCVLFFVTANNAVTTLKPCHKLAYAEQLTVQSTSKLFHLDIRGLKILHQEKQTWQDVFCSIDQQQSLMSPLRVPNPN